MFACLYVLPLAGQRTSPGLKPRPTVDSRQRTSDSTAQESRRALSERSESKGGLRTASDLGLSDFGLRTTSDLGPRTSDDKLQQSDLASLAREFSPRVEVHGPGLVTLDAHGLERLFGDANALGQELRRAAADRGLPARVALASTRPAAWLAAHARAGLTIVPAGHEARWLSPLPLHLLEQLAANGLGPLAAAGSTPARAARDDGSVASLLSILKRWGLKTLGEFADLPPRELSERFGQQGLRWQRTARGEDTGPLVPDEPDERFDETLDLDWPIEGLQPLSFVLARLFDALSARLAARDRAVAVLHIHLHLVTREIERRSLQLPAPMRESRVLRTLALLHLEAHPVAAGIDRVTVVADPVPGRIIQCSLLTRALPLPEQLSTLLGRLGAVMGDRRCGMAALVDSHRPGAFTMQPFSASVAVESARGVGKQQMQATPDSGLRTPDSSVCLRRFRIPVPASVSVAAGRPARVSIGRQALRGGAVQACAGPWRTSGEWWRVSEARVQADGEYSRAQIGWNRDEWDVNLADGVVYRIYLDRDRDRWFVDGVVD